MIKKKEPTTEEEQARYLGLAVWLVISWVSVLLISCAGILTLRPFVLPNLSLDKLSMWLFWVSAITGVILYVVVCVILEKGVKEGGR